MSMCRVFSCVVGKGCLLWPVHSLVKNLSLCPASFRISRPNLPVTPGVSWLLTFAFQSPIMKRTSFLGVLKGLVGLHRTVQLLTGKFGLGIRNEAGQSLIEFCQESALVITNTLFQQHKRRLYMDITRWSTPKSDWLYSLQPKMEKLYTISKNKTRSWLWLRPWTPYCQI